MLLKVTGPVTRQRPDDRRRPMKKANGVDAAMAYAEKKNLKK